MLYTQYSNKSHIMDFYTFLVLYIIVNFTTQCNEDEPSVFTNIIIRCIERARSELDTGNGTEILSWH